VNGILFWLAIAVDPKFMFQIMGKLRCSMATKKTYSGKFQQHCTKFIFLVFFISAIRLLGKLASNTFIANFFSWLIVCDSHTILKATIIFGIVYSNWLYCLYCYKVKKKIRKYGDLSSEENIFQVSMFEPLSTFCIRKGLQIELGIDYCIGRNPVTTNHDWNSKSGRKHTVPLDQIVSGGPPPDGIPSIDCLNSFSK
jgi:hypothetical protein